MLSFVAPSVSLALCFVARAWPYGMPYTNIVLTRHYAFLASAILAGYVLIIDARKEHRRFLWGPIAGLVPNCRLFLWTDCMTHIF